MYMYIYIYTRFTMDASMSPPRQMIYSQSEPLPLDGCVYVCMYI